MVHASGTSGKYLSSLLSPLSQKYSLSGFFLLSSFLLTYRLIKDLQKPNSNTLLAILQYSIRRFCRIYIIFIGFCTIGIYLHDRLSGYIAGKYTDLKSALFLQYAGYNILWTIPPELRYYFIIPLVCLIFYKSDRFQPFVLGASFVWTAYDQMFNCFGVSWDNGVSFGSKRNYRLENHFFVFFIGSQLAMTFILIEQHAQLMKFVKQTRFQIFLIIASLVFSIYAFAFHAGLFGNVYDFK